jgi:very-short-patch-repair endonuclease
VVKDEIRDRYITDLGYKVVRVNAKDVFTRRESLKKRLSQLV